jgi:hypothetical protein
LRFWELKVKNVTAVISDKEEEEEERKKREKIY